MAITDLTARASLLTHYHQLTEGDTLSDLEDWIDSVVIPAFKVGEHWLTDNEDGTFTLTYEANTDPEPQEIWAVGDYLVCTAQILNAGAYPQIVSAADFAVEFVVS